LVVRTASLRELNKLPKTAYKVLVTRYYPFYIKNLKKKITEWLPVLAPSRQLLGEFKKELKILKDPKLAWNLVHYDSRFRIEMLRRAEPIAALRRLRGINKQLKGKRVVYLICHETTDEYCHRRILKELIEMELGD